MELPSISPSTARPVADAPVSRTGGASGPTAAPDARTHAAARAFEASFLAEMLQYTGLNATPKGFGGGAGEEAFGSLLTEQYAKLLAERGGIGLAERIFDAMKGKRDA